METKFTKGPWKAFQNEVGSWEVNCRTSEGGDIGRYSPTICSIWDVTYTELNNKLQKPNAHLIAAAPEMYEMLEEISHVLGHNLSTNHKIYIKSISELLAKARGEQ